MEIEDYGLVINRRDGFTGDSVRGPESLQLPVPYRGGTDVCWIQFQNEDVILATITKIADGSESFYFKVSVWEDGEKCLESTEHRRILANENDLREAIFQLSAPLIDKHQAHFAQSFRTHFARLADWLNINLKTQPKQAISLDNSNT